MKKESKPEINDRKKMTLQEQADEIMRIAEESGVQSNFFFLTTFKRYQVQMSVLSQLEAEIRNGGALVEKEYVKGRKNVYTNPAISEYNKTSSAANNTVSTLINIIKQLRPEDTKEEKEESLSSIMKGLLN